MRGRNAGEKPQKSDDEIDREAEGILRGWITGTASVVRRDGCVYIAISFVPKGRRCKLTPIQEYLKKRFRGLELYLLVEPMNGHQCVAYCRPPKEREFESPFAFHVPRGLLPSY